MNRRNLALILGASLLGLLYLTLSGQLGETIIRPGLYYFWVAIIFVDSIPQALWWALFVLVAVFLAIRSVPKLGDWHFRKRPPNHDALGQVTVWQERLRSSAHGNYAQWKLARDLGQLTFQVLAWQRRKDDTQIKEQLRRNQLDLPDKTRTYLRVGLINFNPFEQEQPPLQQRVQAMLPTHQPQPDLTDATDVTTYLEQTLTHTTEIHHEP